MSFFVAQIVTARKQSLRRLCFYTCLSFCPRRGLPQCMLGYHTPGAFLLPPGNEVCEGYVFTHVCHSVHGGQYPSMHCRWYPSMPCSRSPGGGIPACLAGFQAHTQGEVERSGRGGSPGPHPDVVCIPACIEADPSPPPNGYCCGWYASYWNAFLLGFCEEFEVTGQLIGLASVGVTTLIS